MSKKPHTIKKELDPHQLTIICDTREQNPICASPIKMVRGTLTTGDYTLQHYEDRICIERKSAEDFLACVGRERERFERELHRMRAYDVRVVVIEGLTWGDIERGNYRSQVKPQSVLGSMHAWTAKGITFHLVDNHQMAGKHIARILFSYAKHRWLEAHQFIEGAILAQPETLELCPRTADSQNLPHQAS